MQRNGIKQKGGSTGITVVPAEHDGQTIVLTRPDQDIAEAIRDDEIVIFRGVFSQEDVLAIRTHLKSYGESTPVFPAGQSASVPFLNFHRRDDGSGPTTLPHIFHIYAFGQPSSLSEPLRSLLTLTSSLLMDLQNRIAGTNFDLSSGDYKTNILRHPRGGGYLANHVHPYMPQKVSLFLNLSEPGRDYQNGEACFKMRGNWISTLDSFRMGDILAWHYGRVHGVSPVDPEATIDWDNDDGLWIYALEAVVTHGASHKT